MSPPAGPVSEPTAMAALQSLFAALPGASRFNDQECELIYGRGCNFFSQGKYEKASEVFSFLAFYRPLEPRYITANAMCQKLLKRFDMAVQLFSTVMTLDPDNPKPVMHAAECFFALGQEQVAIEALEMVIAMAGEHGEHAALRERAEGWLALAERT